MLLWERAIQCAAESRQVVTKSELTAKQALLVNEIVLTYTDGAYPPADAGDASSAAGNGLTAGGSLYDKR